MTAVSQSLSHLSMQIFSTCGTSTCNSRMIVCSGSFCFHDWTYTHTTTLHAPRPSVCLSQVGGQVQMKCIKGSRLSTVATVNYPRMCWNEISVPPRLRLPNAGLRQTLITINFRTFKTFPGSVLTVMLRWCIDEITAVLLNQVTIGTLPSTVVHNWKAKPTQSGDATHAVAAAAVTVLADDDTEPLRWTDDWPMVLTLVSDGDLIDDSAGC